MTISHEGCFNRHVAPRTVEQTSIVMYCLLPLHEFQTDILGHTLHWSYVVQCVPGVMIMPRSKEQRDHFLNHVEASQILVLFVCTLELWIQVWWDNRPKAFSFYSALQWHIVLLEDLPCIIDGAWWILVWIALQLTSWMHGHSVGISFLSTFSAHRQTQYWLFLVCQFLPLMFLRCRSNSSIDAFLLISGVCCLAVFGSPIVRVVQLDKIAG